jgi:sulfatase modifying factor 1
MNAASRRRLARWAGGAVVAGLLVAADVHLARRVASSPARCAEGMERMGARCCGEGQHLEGERCAGAPRACARDLRVTEEGCAPPLPPPRVAVPAGTLTIAPGDWEASGVVRWRSEVVEAFSIDAYEVTESRWRACVEAGACPDATLRGEPGLPVVGVTALEAAALCAHEGRGRLPTEAELAMAAAGPGGRRYPWGPTGFVCRRAAWGLVRGPCGHGARGPEIAGAHPAGATPEGVHDLAGNVEEWSAPREGRAAVLGGAYDAEEAAALRTWSRRMVDDRDRSATIGFRCAWSP